MNNNINFEEVEFPRYIKVKESIENLMKIINFQEVKNDGVDRVLHAFLQLIDENDDKTLEEKHSEIQDALYNGNVFKHYFSEENLEKAVEILSNTVLLNDQERLIYIINFYMPNDLDFTNVYKESNKDVSRIAEHYGFSGEESYDFIYARAVELNKFYSEYRAEKERQKLYNEAAAFEEKENVIEESSAENEEKSKDFLEELPDNDLKETLEEQSNQIESGDDQVFEEEMKLDEETQGKSVINNVQVDSLLNEMRKEEHAENIIENNDLETEETLMETEPNLEQVEVTEMPVNEELVEPKPLEEVIEEPKELENSNDVREEVMASLQSLVANSRENSQRVEQLSLELDAKEEELNAKNNELAEKDKMLEESNQRVKGLEEELSASKSELETARQTIETQNTQIATLNRSLYAHQEYLVQLQQVLNGAQPIMTAQNEEETRKLR